jgi:hypothetical protein
MQQKQARLLLCGLANGNNGMHQQHPWQKGNRYDDAWLSHAFHFEPAELHHHRLQQDMLGRCW